MVIGLDAEKNHNGSISSPHCFFTIPWIHHQGDELIRSIEKKNVIETIPIQLHDTHSNSQRHALNHIAWKHPNRFANYFERKLIQSDKVSYGLLLTHDWPPPMQIASQVARAHGLPVFVITHEAVFAETDNYYKDRRTGINIPQADHVFVWGNLQKSIFLSRGISDDRIAVVGSPKLAACASPVPKVSRDQFRKQLGISDDKPHISFIAQPLDNLDDKEYSRDQQIELIASLAALCGEEGWALSVRLPPTSDAAIIENRIMLRWPNGQPFILVKYIQDNAISDPATYLLWSDIVVSYSSTMLIEATLMGRPAIIYSTGLPATIWEEKLGLPVARDENSLRISARAALERGAPSLPLENQKWIEWAFSTELNDKNAIVENIRNQLVKRAGNPKAISNHAQYFTRGSFPNFAERLFRFELGFQSKKNAISQWRKRINL